MYDAFILPKSLKMLQMTVWPLRLFIEIKSFYWRTLVLFRHNRQACCFHWVFFKKNRHGSVINASFQRMIEPVDFPFVRITEV